MSKVVLIPGGKLTLAESKAVCPECEREIPLDEIEAKWQKQDNHWMRIRCKCKRMIGISTDIGGDFVAFKLKQAYRN